MSTMSNLAGTEKGVASNGIQGVTDEMKYQLHQYQQHQHDFDVMDKQLESNKELNAQMNRYQGESIMQQVSGLRNAGLSPALASGTMSTGGSGGSVGAPSSSVPYDHSVPYTKSAMEMNAMDNSTNLTNAQVNLLNQQAEYVDAQTELLEYDVNERYDTDKTISAFAHNYYNNVLKNKHASSLEKSTAEIFTKFYPEGSKPGTPGTTIGVLRGINAYLDTYGYNYQKLADVVEDKLRADYAGAMKKREFALLGKQIANLAAHTMLLLGQKDLLPEEKNRIVADIARINQLRKAILHGDLIESYREDPTATMTAEGFKFARDVMTNVAGGAAFGGGIEAAKNIFGRPPKEPLLRERNTNTTRTNTTYSHPTILSPWGEPIRKSSTSMESLYKSEY